MDKGLADELRAGMARIEQRQMAYEVVAHKILNCIEIHNEKVDLLIRELNRVGELVEDLSVARMEDTEPLPDWVTDPSVSRPEPAR